MLNFDELDNEQLNDSIPPVEEDTQDVQDNENGTDNDEELKTLKGIYETSFDSTELTKTVISYDNLSVDEDSFSNQCISEIEEFLQTTTYDKYIKAKQRKYKYIEFVKFNECITKCKRLSKYLRLIDVFDAIIAHYELDYAQSWHQLNATHQKIIANEVKADTGNCQLIDMIAKSYETDISAFK